MAKRKSEPMNSKEQTVNEVVESLPLAQQTPQRTWADAYQPRFTSVTKGFELAEDRRYRQLIFRFKEKPAPEVLAKLREVGFRWNGQHQMWTIPADAVNREQARRLAHELHGQEAEAEISV